MAINPQHYGTLTFLDFSNEKSTMSFYFYPVTILNMDDFLADFGDLRLATEAIVLGELAQDMWVGDRTVYSAVPPSNVNAQRERKFLVTYQDAVTLAKYNLEIPTADLTGRMVDDTDLVDLTNTQIAAWITAFEGMARSIDGNGVNVLEIRAVGRNN